MTLTLRDIPLDLNDALQKKAAEQRRPVDEVAVEAIKAGLGFNNAASSVQSGGNLVSAIRSRFAPSGGLELPEPTREPMRDPLEFEQ